MRTTAALLGLVALALAGPARAEGDHKGPEAGLFLGAHFFSSTNELGLRDVGNGGGPVPGDGFLFGPRFGWAINEWVTPELELGFVPTDELVVGIRAHALVHPLGGGQLRPFLVAGFGTHAITGDGDGITALEGDNDPGPHWGLGSKWELNEHAALRLDFRHLIVARQGGTGATSDVELQAGFQWRFGKSTPPPPSDTDGDGILDKDDVCVAQAEDKDFLQDEDGCPEDDVDGDGVKDADDKCPNQPGTKNGCVDTDPDNDGIEGDKDACPTEPEDKDGFEDENGCPDPDNDADGLADDKDTCKDQPETKNGFQDEDGCPDEVPEAVQKFTGAIQGIRFAAGSAKIEKSSNKILDDAAKVLAEFPAVKLEIQGHTSDDGARDKNVELSQKRADAVKEYLVGKGIAAERLIAKGFGPDQPTADNKTKEGREKNRRIEFKLAE